MKAATLPLAHALSTHCAIALKATGGLTAPEIALAAQTTLATAVENAT